MTEIVAVEDLSAADATQFTVTELFGRAGADQPLTWSGQLPTRAARQFRQAGLDIRELLGASPAELARRQAA